MAQLAIKGHPTRGKEVIQLLEMLGGSNFYNYSADCDSLCFYIGESSNIIHYDWVNNCYDVIVHTLEEFEKKFPYKVGDEVIDIIQNRPVEIYKMSWSENNNCIYYDVKRQDNVGYRRSYKFLQPYKEETMEEPKELIIGFTKDDNGDWVLNTHKDYEIKEIEGKYKVIKKKPQYPKDYIECEASGLSSNPVTVALAQGVCMGAFAKLIVLRNAYWEIAGKQLGLDKPWKPDWEDEYETYYTISYCGVNIKCYNDTDVYSKLAFPTEEMRDAFFENFKGLIEQCKELL